MWKIFIKIIDTKKLQVVLVQITCDDICRHHMVSDDHWNKPKG